MNDPAVMILIDHINKHYSDDGTIRHKAWFAQHSYSQWAASEILIRVMDHPTRPVLEVIEEFMIKMDVYSCMNIETSLIFSIAKDTAEDIMMLFV